MTDNNALAQELEALGAKATKGPWEVFYYDAGDKTAWDNCPSIQAPESEDCAVIHWDGFKQEYWTSANGDQRQIDGNAALIVALRNNLPTILAALRTPAPIPVGGDVVGLLNAILDAQNAQPYRGWNITKLNKAVDAAREHLGLPSIRELNPDIAAMQDHARANKDAIQSALQAQPAPAQGDDVVERVALAAAVAIYGPGFDPHLNPEAFDFCMTVARAALAAMQPKVEAPAADEVRELVHKLRGVAAYSAVDVPVLKQAADMLECLSHPTADAVVANFHLIDKANHVLMIKSHVEAERERCAQVAEWHGENVSNEPVGKACSLNIARAIRSGGAS